MQWREAGASSGMEPDISATALTGRLVVLALAAVLLVQAAGVHAIFPPAKPPLFYHLYATGIILPMHEGGHLLFRFFGEELHALGGSFWQIMFPLLLFGVALRQRSWWAAVYLALAGVAAVDITSYIFDAPFQSLPLLGGKRVGHDWHFLLIRWNLPGEAEIISTVVYWSGIVIGWCGVLGGAAASLRPRVKRFLPGMATRQRSPAQFP